MTRRLDGFRTSKAGNVFPLFSGQTDLRTFVNLQSQDAARQRPVSVADEKERQRKAAKIQRIRTMLAESELKQEAREITKQTGVLTQPAIVNTASIPDALIAKPPTAFKKYSEGARSFEVSEEDFVQRYIEKERTRLAGNLKYWQAQLDTLGPKATAKRRDAEMSVEINKRLLARIESNDPEKLASITHDANRNYNELVRVAIKKGEPVPDAVVEQKPEFQIARDARRRYEKGLHTSFANKSAAVNAVMFHEKGYKVKRQDGKEIASNQIQEIDHGMGEISLAVGDIKDVTKKGDLTIAHTSGKFPFLDGASSGLFHPTENTVTTGVVLDWFGKKLPMRSLAHEVGHYMDFAAGSENKRGYDFYTNGKSQRRIKSFKEALSKSEEYKNPLYEKAKDAMNSDRTIRKLLNPSLNFGKEPTKEEIQEAKAIRARIGSYYRDPREVWARLFEQYVSVKNAKETTAAEAPEYYHAHPAYWNKESWTELEPLVKAEIDRRIQIGKGQ